MLEQMSGHHQNLAAQAQQVGANMPQPQDLHNQVDQILGSHAQIKESMLQGMSQASAVAVQHATNAKALQEPMINAENEFNRIMQLLSVPMISLASPAATMARTPANFNA